MEVITNNKIGSLDGRWAGFRGFTFLFDNPGASFLPRGGLEYVSADPGIPLYRGLHTALGRMDLPMLTRRYMFFPLSPRSYHVTACDGGNADNLAQVNDARRKEVQDYLEGLPSSFLCHRHAFTRLLEASELVQQQEWGIRLAFDALANWSGVSLVACLKPADTLSAERLDRFRALRQHLCDQLDTLFAIRPPALFVPHVTLGYFAHPASSQGLGGLLEEGQDLFRRELQQAVISFDRISLYGFTDMETFFRRGNNQGG